MLYYSVTPKQFKKLEKDFKPRYMNEFEKKSLENFYSKVFNN